jgi:glycosyltransferase involved in cell wall biosynthesis
MARMRILFLSHQAEFIYGGEVVTLAFMEELARNGVEVHFAAPPGAYAERARTVARVHEIPSRQFSRKLAALPALAAAWLRTRNRLAEICTEEKIDAVHATSLKAMVYAWPVRAQVPILWHHHDILPPKFWNDRWAGWLAQGARLILVPSAATRLALVRAGVDPGLVKVLHNGFRPGEWRVRPERDFGAPLALGYVGELSERKGVDRLPEILEACLENQPAQLTLIGDSVSDPDFGAGIRKAFGKLPAEFLGRRTDVKDLLQKIDVLLVPSRQDPLPTVIVEAGLSGVPVIAAPVGGIPEMIADGRNGFLADATDSWVACLEKLHDPEEWRKCSAGARRLAEERYDISLLTQELLGHYREVKKSADL